MSVWLLVVILGAALSMTRASASEVEVVTDDPAIISDTAPGDEPILKRKVDEPVMTTLSTSQCGAGYFCVWSQANYSGTIQRFSAQSQYTSISLYRVGSFYNNRSKRVMLYSNSSGDQSACYGAQAKRSTTSGWVSYAKGTYLSTATSC
jgi:hypothetical protein